MDKGIVVKQKWLRAMGEGNGLRPAQSNGQNPKASPVAVRHRACLELPHPLLNAAHFPSECFSLQNLNCTVEDLVFVSFSATEQACREICAQPLMEQALQVELFHL